MQPAWQRRGHQLHRPRSHRGVVAGAVGLAACAALFTNVLSFASVAGRTRSRLTAQTTSASDKDSRSSGGLHRVFGQRGSLVVAAASSSAAWILPTVDKDIGEFHSGRAEKYAWVQTSDTVYIFAPYLSKDGKEKPDVQLEVQNEGTLIRLTIEGEDAVKGKLSHQLKPGSDVWMIEEAADGNAFAVVEIDKLVPGIEWTSVVQPNVKFSESYSNELQIELQTITDDEKNAAVDETLRHLQRKHAKLQSADSAYQAGNGDLLTINMKGFELGPGDARGALLDIATASGLKLTLGASGQAGAGLLPEVHQQLVGIKLNETRDVKVTLGSRAGSLGGQTILCAMTCTKLQQQTLLDLTDEFARVVKRAEQMIQAGTMEGIPEEEYGRADTITLEELRGEIATEILYTVQKQEREAVYNMMEAELLKTIEVDCDWATPSLQSRNDAEKLAHGERLATVLNAVAQKEGLLSRLDEDKIQKRAWDSLGEPKPGKTVAEVGKNPAREFQTAHRKVFRKEQRELVLGWLEERVAVAAKGAVVA